VNGPLLDLPLLSYFFDPTIARTRNVGLLGGSVQLGDGLTVASFPTFLGLGKRGIALNGSQYLQHLAVIASGTYSIFLLANRTAAVTGYLADARNTGGTGWILDTAGVLTASSGTMYVDGAPLTALPKGLHSVCCSGMTLAATVKTVFGADNAQANGWTGRVFAAKVYPYALQPNQIRALHEQSMMLVNS
jgi:hypothetical protein